MVKQFNSVSLAMRNPFLHAFLTPIAATVRQKTYTTEKAPENIHLYILHP